MSTHTAASSSGSATRRGDGRGGPFLRWRSWPRFGVTRRVAVVTGASRGLGAHLTSALQRRGYAVAGCSTTRSTVAGARLHRAVDVADAYAVDNFADEVCRRLGTIDVWINNAGVLGFVGPVRDTKIEEWERTVAVNLMGVVAGARAFLQRRTERAVLVNIASRAAVGPVPGLAAYAATKAAVVSLTLSLAEEERHRGPRAHVVLPPSIATDMQDVLLGQDHRAFPGVIDARRRRDGGRIVEPGEVADRILGAVLDRDDADVVIDFTGD